MTAFALEIPNKLLTFDDYLTEYLTQAPSRRPFYVRDGVVIMPPAPRPLHQRIIYILGVVLHAFEKTCAIAVYPSPIDLVIRTSPLRTRQPDILVISDALCQESRGMDMDRPFTVAPELVVEVLSPSENRTSLDEKVADYQYMGVQECWIVSPEAQTVEILILTPTSIQRAAILGRSDEVQSIVFPGVRWAVAEIFQ